MNGDRCIIHAFQPHKSAGNILMNAGWIDPPNASTGNPQTACSLSGGGTEPPDEAELGFSLDPWGRLNRGTGSPPYVDRYNARWGNVMVNFVGTGVKNCTLAADPQGCYNSSFIPYNLTQFGPSWVTDYNELWSLLNTPTTIIEGAKGLAAEIWLDPLKDGWSTSYIAPLTRSEFTLGPLGGSYELDFKVPPEVILSNIQRVQILVGSTAWVKEQQ
jgi:hypothetical protein